MRAYRRLLRRRAFALLWTGATISALGDGLSWIALVWLLLELGGSSGSIGLLVAAYTGPVIVSGLVAGHLLDRFDRRRVLIVDNVIRGLAIATIPILSATGNLATWQLYAVAIVYGSLFMISLAGVPTLIASLVPDDELTTANAMETMSYAIGGLAGPALAGLLIGVFGASNVLLLDAASYGAFALCLVAMRAGLAADRDSRPAPAQRRRAGAPACRHARRRAHGGKWRYGPAPGSRSRYAPMRWDPIRRRRNRRCSEWS
jgi:MFS family permease